MFWNLFYFFFYGLNKTMTDLSGKDSNRAFRAISTNGEPYYYITSSIDVSDLEVNSDSIYYFTRDNSFSYLDKKLYANPSEYGGYYMIDSNSIIGEITVYSSPDIEYSYGDLEDLNFSIGGAYNPEIALTGQNTTLDIWAGPTGNVPDPIGTEQLHYGQICYYGRAPESPGVDPDDASISRKFLALKIEDNRSVGTAVAAKSTKPKVIRKRKNKLTRQLGFNLLDSGKIYVVIKVYPKFT